MQDILDHAVRVAPEALALAGEAEGDWPVLRAVASTTTPWAHDLAALFVEELQRCEGTARFLGAASSDREANLAMWLEKLLSGAPGDGFWGECCFIGLLHAAAGVQSRHVVALAARIELAFAERLFATLDAADALVVYTSFKRLFGVAIGLIVDTATHALQVGMNDLGMNERVVKTMRRVAIRRMVDGARERLPLIDWSDAIAVGIPEIDAQHRRLVDLLNALHAVSAGGNHGQTARILRELTDYTVTHFAYEERLLEAVGYPDLAAHRASHAALVARVGDITARFEAGRTKLDAELFTFLRSWLNGHIRGTDRHYAAYVLARGDGATP